MPFKSGEEWNGKPAQKGAKRLPFKLASILKDQLQRVSPDKQKLYAQLFIETLMEKAFDEGDMQAYKLIFQYVDGMPKQQVEVETGKNLNSLLEELHGINRTKQITISGQDVEDEQSVQDNRQERNTSDLSDESITEVLSRE